MGNGESILQSFINIQIEKQQLSFKVQSPYKLRLFLPTIKPFLTVTYYRLPQWTVESIAADCIVHPSRPYSPLAESVADDCKKKLNYMEEKAYTTTLFRFYLFQIIRRSQTDFIFKTLTEISRTVNYPLECNL